MVNGKKMKENLNDPHFPVELLHGKQGEKIHARNYLTCFYDEILYKCKFKEERFTLACRSMVLSPYHDRQVLATGT